MHGAEIQNAKPLLALPNFEEISYIGSDGPIPIIAPRSIIRETLPLPSSSKIHGFLEPLDAKIADYCCHPDAVKFRRNFKQNRNELTERLVELYNQQIFESKLLDITVSWSKTLRKCADRCRNFSRGTNRTSVLELNEKVITTSNSLRDSLIHELYHAAAWIFDLKTGHEKFWKKWTKRARECLPELPEITVKCFYCVDYKYTSKCAVCGLKYKAHSKSKKIKNTRCSHCRGTIEVFLNKKDKSGKITLVKSKEASGFPKYVKENYKLHKVNGRNHATVMKLLSSNYSKLTAQEKLNYK